MHKQTVLWRHLLHESRILNFFKKPGGTAPSYSFCLFSSLWYDDDFKYCWLFIYNNNTSCCTFYSYYDGWIILNDGQTEIDSWSYWWRCFIILVKHLTKMFHLSKTGAKLPVFIVLPLNLFHHLQGQNIQYCK